MKVLLIAGLTGALIGVAWHWALLRTVSLLVSDRRTPIAWIVCFMLVRVCVIGIFLAVLLVTGGPYCLFTALVAMMAVRGYFGLLAVRGMGG